MNFGGIFKWVIGIVLLFAAAGKRHVLQAWIWKSEAQILYESRPAAWGSPVISLEGSGLHEKITVIHRKIPSGI